MHLTGAVVDREHRLHVGPPDRDPPVGIDGQRHAIGTDRERSACAAGNRHEVSAGAPLGRPFGELRPTLQLGVDPVGSDQQEARHRVAEVVADRHHGLGVEVCVDIVGHDGLAVEQLLASHALQ